MVMRELKSPRNRLTMKRIDDSCGVLPHADYLSRICEIALDIGSMKPEDRIQAAQEALGYLGPFDDCELEDCL